jgi:glucuronosyltransferase
MMIYLIPLFVFLPAAANYKILAMFPHSGKSHFDVFKPYLEQLAAKGHQLLVISHFPRQHSTQNYEDIDLRGTLPTNKTINIVAFKNITHGGQVRSAFRLGAWGSLVCEKTVQNPQVKSLITSSATFDLFITEEFNTDCFLAIAHKFQIPVITFSSCSFWPWTPARLGTPDNPSYIPIQFAQSSNKMNFFERFSNTFWYLFHHIHHPFLMDAPAHRITKQHFGESLPYLSLLARNTSLIFVNNHFSLNGPRPLVPGVIEVAGIHIKPTEKLPEVRRVPITNPQISLKLNNIDLPTNNHHENKNESLSFHDRRIGKLDLKRRELI